MSNEQSNDKNELLYIYSTLRSLKIIRQVGLDGLEDPRKTVLSVESLFPKRFFLILIDDRLFELNKLAKNLVSSLFSQLIPITERVRTESIQNQFVNTYLLTSKCHQLDEYFHHTLYYLYDFLIQLNWHEADIARLSESDSSFVVSKLTYLRNFFIFQKALTDFNLQFRRENETNKLSANSAEASSIEVSSSNRMDKSYRSSLSPSSKLDTPSRGRRVTFQDLSPSVASEHRGTEYLQTNDQFISDEQAILALDLLLYSLNLFVERLCENLNDWYKSESNLKLSLDSIMRSKQKIRTRTLESISNQIKSSNNVYLTCLDHLSDMRNIYLIYYVLEILCNPESGRVINIYKSRRVQAFIQRVLFEVEKKVIFRLANQSLQLILELLISEINLPPVELESKVGALQKGEAKGSRENYFNFIISWLNVDDIMYGFATSKRTVNSSSTRRSNKASSTLATSGQFRSSSRILTQMDNLNELMRDLLEMISNRVHSRRQLKYLLELIHSGLETACDYMTVQLLAQLKDSRAGLQFHSNEPAGFDNQNVSNLSKSAELISTKVRCLKLIHIMSELNHLVKDLAIRNDVELLENALGTKLTRFTDDCMRQTGSTYTIEKTSGTI